MKNRDMAPISPGTMSGPPRRPKKPTATTKAHRFEGFAKRISKIKIDPVHTVQKSRIAEDNGDLSNSFFRSALDEWAELNLTATFTSFLNKAQPLSESLPQLLHHADKIFSLLHEHIEKQEVLALEPLLSLVAHLAHDLGPTFEKYFASTVTLVAKVSAAVDDPAAIESCFTCLAWMFKYLSKLLVQDLRPLLEIMVPYFSSKKDYVRRFSAESLAFLLRKAALMYTKRSAPLKLALTYLFDKLAELDGSELQSFKRALMTLLFESAIGVEAQLHSSVVDLFRCVFQVASRAGSGSEDALAVVDGTVIGLIHQTNAKGFLPLLQLIADIGEQPQEGTSHNQMATNLLLDVIATRKGSRISDWKSILEVLVHHLKLREESAECDTDVHTTLITISAITMQYCPMDQLLPFVKDIVDSTTRSSSSFQFFAFCEMVAKLGRQRFLDILLSYLQKYIVSHWSTDEDNACYLLQQLHQNYTISHTPGNTGYVSCPKNWEESILQRIGQDKSHQDGLPVQYAKFFVLNEAIHFPKDDSARNTLCNKLSAHINSALDHQHAKLDMPIKLCLGWCFKSYLASCKDTSQDEWQTLAKKILRSQPEYYQLVPYLESCLVVLKYAKLHSMSPQDIEPIETSLCGNMLSDSLDLRRQSLEILLTLGKFQNDSWLTETCDFLLELINTPYLPSNARQIAMLIRRLPKQQELCNQSSPLRKLIPLCGLGLVRQYHDQTRKDLCIALGRVAAIGNAEEVILDVVVQWLHKPGILEDLPKAPVESETSGRLSPFECSNYNTVKKQSEDIFQRHSIAADLLQQEFQQAHVLRPATTHADSRILALEVFLEISEIAEKRSRVLSPVFLSVQQGMTNHHSLRSDESTSSHTISPDFNEQAWSLRERKLFLELMGKFVNPRVLYRARELYDHLMELLTNGNSDIRKLALLALLNWKDPSLPQYQDVLLRVAEEKNATTELALLLASDEETGSIKIQDRSNVLPVLLRLVFGQLVGRSGTHGSQEAKRKSILRLLFRMEESEINTFLGIALGRLGEISFSEQAKYPSTILDRNILSQDQQYGFLRMMLSIQEILQSQYAPYGKKVIDAVMYCTARACRQTNHVLMDDTRISSATALARNIRRSGIQCLTTIFEFCTDISWDRYLPVISDEIVNPRVPNLSIELAQGISGLLRLFSVWCKSQHLASLLGHNPQLSQNLWRILAVPSARDDVKVFVLEHNLMPLLEIASDTNIEVNPAADIVKTDIEVLLESFVGLLQRQPARDLLLAITKVVPRLAPFAVSSSSTSNVLDLLIALLCEPAQRIPPHVKGQLLTATESLLRIQQDEVAPSTKSKLYDVVSGLYNYFKDQPNRVTLGNLLSVLAKDDSTLMATVQICQDLNAISVKHLGETDYERQLGAYNTINTLVVTKDTSQQWSPILNNLLYYARTADDFAIRSNAVNSLKHYIVEACNNENADTQTLVRTLLLPAFKKGIKENSELVRADFVVMYGLVVKSLPDAPDLEDMKVLLVGGDEEASFFANILHIQQHRRVRAIRRLLTEVERGVIKPKNIAEFFLPLLEKFIDDDVDDETAGVKGQSIAATSTLLQWIEWKSFRTNFRQYKSDLDNGSRPEKDAIKLLSNAADALTAVCVQDLDNEMTDVADSIQPHLKATLPPMETISTELKTNFIPKLSKFIHHKDEAEISLRIPAAKVAVKLIKLLPSEETSLLVAPIILDISQILRSRTQESRDIARNTLAEIVLLLGSSSIQFVLKEMRTTLSRGYQLHVLSYTLHTILLQSAPTRQPGDLDYCLEDLVAVIMDDIFGVVGQEKENQDYISSMREVKSSKSQDSMELLAKTTSVTRMSKLITPFQALLAGNLSTRQVRQVDELLRRVGVGISHNPSASSRELLVFAYELIQAFYRQKAGTQPRELTNDEKNRQRYLVQLKSAGETTSSTSSSLQYKIARFALDLVRSTLAKHTTLLTAENVHGFLPVIGDALIEAQEDVRISAFRLLSTIIRLPLSELDQNASLYVMEAVKVVKNSINTNEESPQSALKLVASILRERKDVQVRDSDIAYLLHRTMPDIEEPDRQGVVFNFIKAVMARKYQLPEVYELMDKVGAMMVTNQSRSGRDVARGVYVHFLLDYPQSKNRWGKQLRFLVKNLDYEFREGRQSVMEAVHVLLQKLSDDLLQEVVSTFFIPLVLRMANDDDSGCREMAGALLAQVFRVADRAELKNLLDPLRSWLEQTDNLALAKVGMQAWTVYFDVVSDGADAEIPAVRKHLTKALQSEQIDESDWEFQYQALELFSRLVSAYPAMMLTQSQAPVWTIVRQLLSSHHVWLQISAASLISAFFQDCADDGMELKSPLTSRNGLRFDSKAMIEVLRSTVRIMKRNEGNMNLAQKALEILVFLAKYVEINNLTCEVKANANADNTGAEDEQPANAESESDNDSDSADTTTRSIPAIQYLLDQLTHILRREPNKITTLAFTPRLSALSLLTTLIPQLTTPIPNTTLTALLVPLTHITDPSLQPPRSADSTFPETYTTYTESAHALQETIQRKVGDTAYVALITEVSKIIRGRRGERKMKRAFDRVAEPERAQREKKRKQEIKARRKKSLVDIHRKRRRGDLGF